MKQKKIPKVQDHIIVRGFSSGNIIKVAHCFHGHEFEIGEMVCIVGESDYDDGFICRNAKGVEWYLHDVEFEYVTICPSCGSVDEYSQGFKQNIMPVDGGDCRQVCFNICDKCGYAIDVWFWD